MNISHCPHQKSPELKKMGFLHQKMNFRMKTGSGFVKKLTWKNKLNEWHNPEAEGITLHPLLVKK